MSAIPSSVFVTIFIAIRLNTLFTFYEYQFQDAEYKLLKQ